ncbi:MAG TPA: DedA family protein [Chloroflexota bacterium]|nr:DedA family protein [Chloroflexota bacterium]
MQEALRWLAAHEALLVFLAIFFEECGIPMPLPADVAMAVAGHAVAQGRMRLLDAFLIGQSATLAGSSVLYWAGRRGGRSLLLRYGRLLRLGPERIDRMERLVRRLGPLAVIIGRQIPGLRLASPLACGVFGIPFRTFVPAMIVGSSVYIAIFLALGAFGGAMLVNALSRGLQPLRFVVATVLLIAALLLLRRLGRRAAAAEAADAAAQLHLGHALPPGAAAPGGLVYHVPPRRAAEAGLAAGLGASAITGLVFVWLLGLLGLLSQTRPEIALARFLASAQVSLPPLRAGAAQLVFAGLVVSVPVVVAVQLGYALVYALFAARRLRGPGVVRGLLFGFSAWLCTGVAVFPLAGAGPFGLFLELGEFSLAGTLLLHAVFGAALGSLYRMALVARRPGRHGGRAARRGRGAAPHGANVSGGDPVGGEPLTPARR